MPPDRDQHIRRFDDKFWIRVTIFCKLFSCDLNTQPKTLDVSQYLHGFCKVRIAIARYARLAEVLFCHLTVGATRTVYLNAIRKPVNSNWSIGSFISTMKDGISGKLLKSRQRIFGTMDLNRTRRDRSGDRIVRLKDVIESAKKFRQRTINLFSIPNWIGQRISFKSQKLDLCARNVS